ncbi:MAG TPA: glutamate synthase (NADPH), homotetrameric [Firmicutes bacterium]|nr:glutamate synthase (NADPH), homotetrameric [Bacillota bacterium]
MLERTPMTKRDPAERRTDFNEVALGYQAAEAQAEASRCLNCRNAPCVKGCPVGINIPQFVTKIAAGDFAAAATIIKKQNSLPAICGRVCPQEEQCEGVCTLARLQKPIAIGALERFAADYDRKECAVCATPVPAAATDAAPVTSCSRTGKSVAVIGSGPAGLTVAADLACRGHEVVVYEALHAPGGVLSYGIPQFRLPKEIVHAEVDYVKSLGVEFRTNAIIGQTYTLEELRDRYDAIFIGTGAGLPYFLGIPGENLNGVYSANEFLTRVNLMKAYLFPEYATPVCVGKKVTVVGAGNTAMDSARTALRLGADEVTLVYRRTRAEMPARAEEIENAVEEGVILKLQTNPTALINDGKGWVRSMTCIRTEQGAPDASGRCRPVDIPNSEHTIETDTVIVATGQGPNPLLTRNCSALEVSRKGCLIVDPQTGQTNLPGVFAGGDIVSGGATVIAAMGAGRRAAMAIHEMLTARTLTASHD